MRAPAYSVLSHEALVDALWTVKLRGLLLARFPNATPAQLKEAHGYAYGGAIIQDEGYYPHGNGYFSDLTHYARSADFIRSLLTNARTLDEYAFALGALSHWAGDNDGHALGTNVVEPMVYPKLARKYGPTVTYEQDPYDHLRTEYGFDVEQVAQGHYAPSAYHDFIGFYVSKSLLETAFLETYGFPITGVLTDFDKSINSYRHSLSTLIPLFTRVAWANHADEIRKAQPGITRSEFVFIMSRSSYERYWGKDYDKPSLFDRLLAFLLKLLPPVGEIKVLKFRALNSKQQAMFMHSFDVATHTYLTQAMEAADGQLNAANTNFDTGKVTGPGEYKLQDQTYAYWLDQLADDHFSHVTPAGRTSILGYYSDPEGAISTKKNAKRWQRVQVELSELRSEVQPTQN